jgi:hypothetical protein
LSLHHVIINCHTSVDTHFFNALSRIFAHWADNFTSSKTWGFEHWSYQMAFLSVRSKSYPSSSCVIAPMRSKYSLKCWHKVDIPTIVNS